MAKHDELIKLIQENPDLKVVPMVDNGLCGEDYNYYMGSWGECSIDEYYVSDERIYFKSNDVEEMVEELISDRNLEGTEEEFKLIEEEVNNYRWEKCIVVYIKAH